MPIQHYGHHDAHIPHHSSPPPPPPPQSVQNSLNSPSNLFGSHPQSGSVTFLHQNHTHQPLPQQYDDYQPDLNNGSQFAGSPQVDSHSFHAPSPSPSTVSVHSTHSPHSPHSFHSGQQSPKHFAPTFADAQLPTYHGRQGTFAGFVNSGPLTSPRASFANFISQSPTSPFAPNAPSHGHSHSAFGTGRSYPHKRLSVSSIASSNYQYREEGMDHGMEGHTTADGSHQRMSIHGISNEGPRAMDSYSHGQSQSEGRDHMEREDFPPSWGDLKTKAGKDRKRLPLACIACRRKKIRCSGQNPACKHCLRSRVPCVYKTNTRKATPRTDYMAMLDKRLKRMEERVIKLVPKDHEATSTPRAILKPTITASTKSPRRSRKRAAEEAFREENKFDAWFRHGDASDKDDLQIKVEHDEAQSLFLDGQESLPSKDIQNHLAEVYFEYVYGQSYPLLHKPTFMRNLSNGKVPPVLVLAICAVSARFSTHPELKCSPAFLRGEEWAAPARTISLRRYETPNITVLIVYILLGLHEFGTCHGGRSWMFAGMAQRMAYSLQLHKDEPRSVRNGTGQPDNKSHTDAEIRRRVMWSCFLMDRFISSGSDRPMCIQENSITIALPVPETEFLNVIMNPKTRSVENATQTSARKEQEELNVFKGTTANLIRLVSIWGRLIAYFNLGQMKTERVPMWDPASRFSSLASMLKEFTFSPDLVWNEDNLATHRAARLDNQFVFVHMVYQHLRIFCHRFALPGWGVLISRKMPQSLISESGGIALDAANEVSYLVKEAIQSNVTAPFAGYATFYACNVLALVVQGNLLSARSTKAIQRAEKNLKSNMTYLLKMTDWWGMFHFMLPELKKLLQATKDARSTQDQDSTMEQTQGFANVKDKGPGNKREGSGIFQYGDWFDKYGTGTRNMNMDVIKKDANGTDNGSGVLGANSRDLVRVEEYFGRTDKEELQSWKFQITGHATNKTKEQKTSLPVPGSRQANVGQPSASERASSSHMDMATAYGIASTYLPRTRDQEYSSRQAQGYTLTVHTIQPMLAQQAQQAQHSVLQSPTSGSGDFSAWPHAEYMSTTQVHDQNGLYSSASGLETAPGMSAGWFMPWNMQPPTDGMMGMGIAGVSGFNMAYGGMMSGAGVSDGMQSWDSTVHEQQQVMGDHGEFAGRR